MVDRRQCIVELRMSSSCRSVRRLDGEGELDGPTLAWAYRRLQSTGRGKHVGRFSYYHNELVAQLPEVAEFLATTRRRLRPRAKFNVVKLSRSRVSFLLYERFSVAFPALLTALSCDDTLRASRFTDYSQRRNPPILHRKELLLPSDHPIVPDAAQLTERLVSLGAFQRGTAIGTRDGWLARLQDLGLTLVNDQLVSVS